MKKIVLFLTITLVLQICHAQQPTTFVSTPQLTGAHDAYGASVFTDGVFAVVGAPMTDVQSPDNGVIWIYKVLNSTLTSPQKLLPPKYQMLGCFGNDVVIDGNNMLIGAYGMHDKTAVSGVVYYYRYNGQLWEYKETLAAPDAGSGDKFGYSIALHGNTAVVGAPGSNNSKHGGKSYVFRLTNNSWHYETQFSMPVTALFFPAFGWDVAVQYDLIAVSALYANSNKPQTGKVFLYRYAQGTWKPEAEVAPADAAKNDLFGTSISLHDERLLVGAPNNTGTGKDGKKTGAAYVFYRPGTNWIQQSKLTGDGGSNSHDYFGTSVSLDNNLMAIGAGQDDFMGKNTGATYVFEFSGNSWTQKNKFTGTINHNDDLYGCAVSLKGTQLLLGASLAEQENAQTNHGIAYFYTGVDKPIIYSNINENAVDAGTGIDVHFFPNPFSANATLTIRTKQLIDDVSVYDMLGRFVKHPELLENQETSFTYSLKGDMPPGHYIVNIKLSNGTKNLVVEKQ